MTTTPSENNMSTMLPEVVNVSSNGTETIGNVTEGVRTLTEMNDAEVVRLIPTLVFLGIISLTGMFGNGLVCHIYRTCYRLSNSQCFILCLSAIDLFSCCIVIPFEISTVVNQYTFEHLWLCKLSRFFNTLGTLSSSFLLLFIAIDRYRKVCKPFSAQISANVAKFLCVLAVLLGLFFSWPAVLVYGKKTFSIPGSELIGTECSTDDSMVKTIYPFINICVYGILFLSGIVSICILYCLIGREVQKHVNRMPKEYINMRTSVPVLSSSMAGRDSKVEGDIKIDTLTRYEKAKTKNEETRKRQKRYSKKHKSASDMSWSEKHDERDVELEMKEINFDMENERQGMSNKEKVPSDSDDIGIKPDQTAGPESQGQTDLPINSRDSKPDHKEVDIVTNKSADVSNNCKCESDKDNVSHTPNSSSPISSTGSLDKIRKSLSGRLFSITSQMSQVLSRMTSITSKNSESSAGTFGKTQYLKQARARKTAFLMFMISLAFVLSYLPHLLLMLIRVLKDDFIANMTDSERAVYRFFLRSYFLNCAINPVIYAACASRFRTECKELFYRMCGKSKSEDINLKQ